MSGAAAARGLRGGAAAARGRAGRGGGARPAQRRGGGARPAAAARGLRGAAASPEVVLAEVVMGPEAVARPEAEVFYGMLKAFLAARIALNAAAKVLMPEKGAAAFADVGAGGLRRRGRRRDRSVTLVQDLGGAAAGVDAQLDALYARAPAAKEMLDAFARAVASNAGLDPDTEMLRVPGHDGHADEVFHAYTAAPLKGRVRAAEKAKNEYGDVAARLVDLVRGSIVCGDEASLVKVLTSVLVADAAGDVCVVRSKNRFKSPLFNGYRDVLVNLRLKLPDGTSMIVELQVHLAKILEFKAETHVYYEYFRTYFCGNVDVVAGRMYYLESIGGDASASLADAVKSVVTKREPSKLKAMDEVLMHLAAYGLLFVVRECLCDMARVKHGEDSPEHASAIRNLASLLKMQGKLADAEPLYRRALEVLEKKSGNKEPLTVVGALNDLAELLRAQGKLADAEPLYRRALARSEYLARPGSGFIYFARWSVAAAQNNLALLLHAQDKLDAAEPLYRLSLAIVEKRQPNHPNLATLLGNLGELLQKQGKLADAEPLFHRSHEIREKQLGQNHPDVAKSLYNLASLLQAQGKLADAEPLKRRSLEIYEKQFEPDHPSVAFSLNNLAVLLWRLGRLDEALPLQERATAIRERRGDAKAEARYRGQLDAMRQGEKYPHEQ